MKWVKREIFRFFVQGSSIKMKFEATCLLLDISSKKE